MTRDEAISEIKTPKSVQSVSLALTVLSRAGTVADVSFLMPIASNPGTNHVIKKLAVDAICTIIKESMLTKFNELAPEMRQKLATILQTLDPQIVRALSADLLGDNFERKMSALKMLGILRRHPQVKALLVKLLPDRDPKIKATAVSLLAKMIGANDQQTVMSLLEDPDRRVRANTIEALEAMRNPRMAPALYKYRKEPNNRIRGNVLKALYNLGHAEIEEDLLDMLSNANPLQKASALWVVKQVKFDASVKVIDAAGLCLMSQDHMVHRNAVAALSTLRTVPRAQGYIKYLSDIFAA